ncbi:MAG: PEP-CTERM sorting domain-containing protein [Planctomycetes bacterium]|nr:PEP-CTERM sorting domain-containing protein [Planctomycetota bacterium]
MRKLLVVATLLVASAAYADNVYENPMDGGAGGWGCQTAIVSAEGRIFTRAYDFNQDAGGWWYVNTYTGEIDVSAAVDFEADVRWHQAGSTPYANAWIAVRLGSPGFGEYFHDPFFIVGSVPPGSVGDEWYRMSFPLSLAVDAGMDLSHFDGFEFYASFDDPGGEGLDWVDFDNVAFTPEPTSLLLLGLGCAVLARRR